MQMQLQWPSSCAVTIAMPIAPNLSRCPLEVSYQPCLRGQLYSCTRDASKVFSLHEMFDVLTFHSEPLIKTRACQVACKPNMAKPYWARDPN